MSLDQHIPSYAEALAWEAEVRELAFLDLPQELCGVEVVPLTLRRLRVLLSARSPFFVGGAPDEGDVAAFLWALALDFVPGDHAARDAHIARLRAVRGPESLADSLAAIGEFLDETFNDAPCSGGGGGGGGPETSFEAAIVDSVAHTYHWTEDAILDCPLRRLYQYLRRIAQRANPKAGFNSRRSRKVKGDWLRSLSSGHSPRTGSHADSPNDNCDSKQPH